MLSSTSSVLTARDSACSCSGNEVAICGKITIKAIAMHCRIMNSNIPL